MAETLHFLREHGYALAFLWVFAEQVGLPIPAAPILIGAGALSGLGEINFVAAVGISVTGAVLADLIWFLIGRSRGIRVLGFLCRMSLEPDSCVRRTEERFSRNTARTLVLAKFLPGLSTAAPPLAGMFGVGLYRFLWLDFVGALLWVGLFCGLGLIFAHQLEHVLGWVEHLGFGLGAVILFTVVLFAGWKYLQRRAYLRGLRIQAVSAVQLKQLMEAGSGLLVVDLRHPMDVAAKPVKIPGALLIQPAKLETMSLDLAPQQDLILYCT